jgi:hypothetical protein
MAAVEAEVVGQYVAIQLVTQLSAKDATAHATSQPTEDCSGKSPER